MELYYYTNMAGQRFQLAERPIEPPDCWEEEEPEYPDDDALELPDRTVLL